MKRFSSIVSRIQKGSKITKADDISLDSAASYEGDEDDSRNAATNSLKTIASIFEPLDLAGKEIRLVNILPGDDQLTCELKTVSLKTYPIYEALSWAWGDPSDREVITVNGHTWWAPVNLVVALEFLRRRDRSRLIWVDALSINQSTAAPALTERAHQVQLMKYIYSAASHVIVWMGEPSEQLSAFLEKCFMGNECMESLLIEDPSTTMHHVKEWLESGWWRRLWVVQEVFLPGKVSYCFGRHSIPFLHVLSETAAFWYSLGLWSEATESYSKYIRLIFLLNDTVGTFLGIRDRYERQASLQASLNRQNLTEEIRRTRVEHSTVVQRHCFEFVEKLVSCRYLLTSDPRDKVYGVLGLGDDDVSELLQPRYDTTVEQVYISTTAKLIFGSQSLYLLSQARGVKESAALLPSWVPDWTAQPAFHDKWHWSSGVSRDDREYIFDIYRNITWIPPDPEILSQGKLNLEGMLVGRISEHTELLASGFPDWWSGAHQWRQFARYNDSASVLSEDGKRRDALEDNRAFWRTILHCTLPRDFVYPVSFPLPTETTYTNYIGEFIKHRPGEILDGQLVGCDAEFLARCVEYPKAKLDRKNAQNVVRSEGDLFRHVTRVTANKKLFRTREDLLGLGPAELKKGDQVWLLRGGTHPFILRSKPGGVGRRKEFRLVGEAYVDGIMWGQDGNNATKRAWGEDAVLVTDDSLKLNKRKHQWKNFSPDEPEIWEDVVLV